MKIIIKDYEFIYNIRNKTITYNGEIILIIYTDITLSDLYTDLNEYIKEIK